MNDPFPFQQRTQSLLLLLAVFLPAASSPARDWEVGATGESQRNLFGQVVADYGGVDIRTVSKDVEERLVALNRDPDSFYELRIRDVDGAVRTITVFPNPNHSASFSDAVDSVFSPLAFARNAAGAVSGGSSVEIPSEDLTFGRIEVWRDTESLRDYQIIHAFSTGLGAVGDTVEGAADLVGADFNPYLQAFADGVIVRAVEDTRLMTGIRDALEEGRTLTAAAMYSDWLRKESPRMVEDIIGVYLHSGVDDLALKAAGEKFLSSAKAYAAPLKLLGGATDMTRASIMLLQQSGEAGDGLWVSDWIYGDLEDPRVSYRKPKNNLIQRILQRREWEWTGSAAAYRNVFDRSFEAPDREEVPRKRGGLFESLVAEVPSHEQLQTIVNREDTRGSVLTPARTNPPPSPAGSLTGPLDGFYAQVDDSGSFTAIGYNDEPAPSSLDSIDPAGGVSYLGFGSWTGTQEVFDGFGFFNHGRWVIGRLTPSLSVPVTATAFYSGITKGIAGFGVVSPDNPYTGSMLASVDFGARQVTGSFSDIDLDSSNAPMALGLGGVRLADEITFSATWTAGTQAFGAEDTLTDLSGQNTFFSEISGWFFGPDAEEIGGNYFFDGLSFDLLGIFAGSQTQPPSSSLDTGGFHVDPDDEPKLYGTGFPRASFTRFTTGALADPSLPAITDESTIQKTVQSSAAFQHVQWGRWSAPAGLPASTFPTGGLSEIKDGWWIAGQLTPAAVLSATQGTAQYTGVVKGSVGVVETEFNGVGQLDGTFALTADFTNRSLTGSFDNLTPVGNPAQFINATSIPFAGTWVDGVNKFTASGSASGDSLSLVGAFFGPDAEEIGGAYTIRSNGNTVESQGIFAGHRE